MGQCGEEEEASIHRPHQPRRPGEGNHLFKMAGDTLFSATGKVAGEGREREKSEEIEERAPRGSPRSSLSPTRTRLQLAMGPDGEILTDSFVVYDSLVVCEEAFEKIQHSNHGLSLQPLRNCPMERVEVSIHRMCSLYRTCSLHRMERVEVSIHTVNRRIHMVRRRILTHPNCRMERVDGLEKCSFSLVSVSWFSLVSAP
jgi:hypothetical protein